MALTVSPDDRKDLARNCESINWQPLMAAMQKPNEGETSEVETKRNIESVPRSDEKDTKTTAVPKMEKRRLSETPNAVSLRRLLNGLNAVGVQVRRYVPQATVMTVWLPYLILARNLMMVCSAAMDKADGSYRRSEPMLCQAAEGKALWKLPSTFNGPEGNWSVDKQVTLIRLKMYKRNHI